MGSAKAHAQPSWEFSGGSPLLLLQFPFLLPLLQPCLPVPVLTTPISQFLGKHPEVLLNVILTHTQVQVVGHLTHSLRDFCNLPTLGKPFEVKDKPLECLSPDATQTLLGDITPHPSRVLDAVIAVMW